MPVVKREEYELSEDQRAQPLVWVERRKLEQLPDGLDDETLELAFGPGKSRKLKSWGHQGDYNAHWLVTRGGTPFHTDPAYARYTHHLVVRNDGWRLTGWEDEQQIPLQRGVIYCLDAHSPHQVVPDPRLIFLGMKPIYKVQAAVDTDTILEPDEVWEILLPMLAGDLTEGAAEAAPTAPAPRPA